MGVGGGWNHGVVFMVLNVWCLNMGVGVQGLEVGVWRELECMGSVSVSVECIGV
jgi:hypothetical protein